LLRFAGLCGQGQIRPALPTSGRKAQPWGMAPPARCS
jgi:hypothetical protein